METVSSRLDTEVLNLFGDLLHQNRSEVVRDLVEDGKTIEADKHLFTFHDSVQNLKDFLQAFFSVFCLYCFAKLQSFWN